MSVAGTATVSTSGAPWYRQFWPWFLIALPASAVVFSFATLYVAVHNADPLVRRDYYDAGIAINKEFAREHAAAARKIQGTLTIDPETLVVRLRLEAAVPIDVPTLSLELTHPTQAERDRTLQLARSADGSFIGQFDALPKGDWHVVLSPPGDEWRLAQRLDLGGPGPHALRAEP